MESGCSMWTWEHRVWDATCNVRQAITHIGGLQNQAWQRESGKKERSGKRKLHVPIRPSFSRVSHKMGAQNMCGMAHHALRVRMRACQPSVHVQAAVAARRHGRSQEVTREAPSGCMHGTHAQALRRSHNEKQAAAQVTGSQQTAATKMGSGTHPTSTCRPPPT